MLGGRPAGRILLAVALVALPLIGLAVLTAGGEPELPASTSDALARVAPGQRGTAQAVRPRIDVEPAARAMALFAVLVGAPGALAVLGASRTTASRTASVRTVRHLRAAGRGPPVRFPR
jgi:hypothetical protein